MGDALAKLLTAAETTLPFTEVFGTPDDPKDNFPFVKHDRLDRILTWPLFGQKNQVLLEEASQAGAWTNPLCHHPSIPANDIGAARVREVKVMVIAPEDPQRTPYCDFKSQFRGGLVEAWPPYKDTNPRVIGFVRINLFDFNFEKLSAKESETFAGLGEGKPRGIVDLQSDDSITTAIDVYRGNDGGDSCNSIWNEMQNLQSQWLDSWGAVPDYAQRMSELQREYLDCRMNGGTTDGGIPSEDEGESGMCSQCRASWFAVGINPDGFNPPLCYAACSF